MVTDTTATHRSIGTVAGCTLLSRVLGLVRDILSAGAFGVGGTWSAFSVAWTVPNLFRRLFGEGALSAAFIPVFTDYLETKDRAEAWRLWGVVTALLATLLGLLLILGEAVLLVIWALGARSAAATLPLALTAVMLPYAFFICLTALKGAVLQSLRRFTVPALAPVILNVCWITAVALIVPRVGGGPTRQIFVLAVAILAAGVLQLLIHFPALKRVGASLRLAWDLHHEGVKRILTLMGPMILGLAIFQLNVLLDKLIAYGLVARESNGGVLRLLGREIALPMQEGAAAALYWADRLYELPVGVFGIAVATVLYPALSAHAARGDTHLLLGDLRKGMRLVVFIGLPAGIGLILLGRPIVALFYGHGRFLDNPDSVARVARILAFYATAVWAYCANQVLVRGYYALKDSKTPVKVGAAMVGLNLALNLTLIWFLAEAGLALATAIAAVARLIVLALILRRRLGRFGGRELAASGARAVLATVVMAAAVLGAMHALGAAAPDASVPAKVVHLGGPLVAGLIGYLVAAALLRCRELKELVGRG